MIVLNSCNKTGKVRENENCDLLHRSVSDCKQSESPSCWTPVKLIFTLKIDDLFNLPR